MTQRDVTIVTPTFRRPEEVTGLLRNIAEQAVLPVEVILVDGAPDSERETEQAVGLIKSELPFPVRYIRYAGGTAVQRNAGIDAARGDFIALIDDDVRLDRQFIKNILHSFADDKEQKVGGIVGYRINRYQMTIDSQRWRWYKRLRLLTVYEPGRYDFRTGYPINNDLQPPFIGTRPVDFMTTACGVWRKEVFETGLRFHTFFRDYGVLEDAHFSLRAGRKWALLQCGDAQCEELHSPNGRVDRRKIGYKCVVNYYFVFRDIVKPLTFEHRARFWRYQAFEFFRIASSAIRRRNWADVAELRGRIDGTIRVARGL